MNQAGSLPAMIATIALMVLGIAMYMVEPLYVGALADHMGLDSGRIGVLIGVEIASVLVVSLAARWWIGLASPRRIAFVAIAVLLTGNLLSLAADSFAMLVACRLLVGLGGQDRPTRWACACLPLSRIRNGRSASPCSSRWDMAP